jgi:hypothetical protein
MVTYFPEACITYAFRIVLPAMQFAFYVFKFGPPLIVTLKQQYKIASYSRSHSEKFDM